MYKFKGVYCMLKRNRSFLLILACLLIVALVAGCGSSSKPSDTAKPEQKAAKVVIKLAHENVSKHPMGMAFIKF